MWSFFLSAIVCKVLCTLKIDSGDAPDGTPPPGLSELI